MIFVLVTVIWIVAMMMIRSDAGHDGLDIFACIVAIASSAFFVTATAVPPGVLNQASPQLPSSRSSSWGPRSVSCATIAFPPRSSGDSGCHVAGAGLWSARAATITNSKKQDQRQARCPSAVFLAYFPLLIPLLVIAIPCWTGCSPPSSSLWARRGRNSLNCR